MGLIVPGMTPDTLGEIYQYLPDVQPGPGRRRRVPAIGFLVFTLMLKVAVPSCSANTEVGSEAANPPPRGAAPRRPRRSP